MRLDRGSILFRDTTPSLAVVDVGVPTIKCVICNQSLPGKPTRVKDNVALEWDPPDGWRRATVDDVKNSYIYFCTIPGCAGKLPELPKSSSPFGPR
jgi:hypothetical protein